MVVDNTKENRVERDLSALELDAPKSVFLGIFRIEDGDRHAPLHPVMKGSSTAQSVKDLPVGIVRVEMERR